MATLESLLKNSFDYQMSGIYTAIPAIIVNADLPNMSVTVQPSISMRNTSGDVTANRPPILNVPLQMPVTDKGGLTFPIGAGCPVMLLFSMRGLDAWKGSTGGLGSPTDVRKFDPRDCIAIPSIFPPSASVNSAGARSNPHSPEDVVLVHGIGGGAECEVRLKPNGDIEINSPTKVTINATNEVIVNTIDAEINASGSVTIDSPESTFTGALTVEGPFTFLDGMTGEGGSSGAGAVITGGIQAIGGTITHNGVDIGDTHTHSGVISGGEDTGTPN